MCSLQLVLLCSLCIGIASAHLFPQIENAIVSTLQLSLVGRRQLLAGRSLLTTAPQCVWTSSAGCELNPDYVTSLNGTPQSNSQKLLARASALDYKCSTYASNATCLSNSSELCTWDTMQTACTVGPGIVDPGWLRDVLYCSGSKADASLTCLALASQTQCAVNSGCVWQSSAQLAANPLGAGLLSDASSWTGTATTAVAAAGGSCAAKWTTNQTVVAELLQKIITSLGTSLTLTGLSATTADALMAPVFTDVFGNCSDVSRYRDSLAACGSKTNSTSCRSVPACSWTASGNGSAAAAAAAGTCGLAKDFAVSLLLDPTDPWVLQYNSAATACASQASNDSCVGLYSINVDTTKYDSYKNLSPDFTPVPTVPGNAASVVSLPSLLLSLMAGLACLLALLL